MISRRAVFGAPLALAAQAVAMPTQFQLACMTLPYSAFPLETALQGIQWSGFGHVAWGTTHREQGGMKPVMPIDAPAAEAGRLARRCRDMGLEPVMMFSTLNLEAANAVDGHSRRIEQAAAAKIPFLLTFGKTSPGQNEAFVRSLVELAPRAKEAEVMIVIKQHGGNTATGAHCARIVKEVGHDSVKVCYDAGNVLDYENHDPIVDIRSCWQDIRAFNIKDHRNTPKDQDCGPGFGEIDHYKLFAPVMNTGLTIPLTFENISEPLLPRPVAIEGVNALAVRARLYIDTVLRGLQNGGAQA